MPLDPALASSVASNPAGVMSSAPSTDVGQRGMLVRVISQLGAGAAGGLTNTELRAAPVPVSGTFWQNTQPVSGPLTDAQLRASVVPVSLASVPTHAVTGPLTDTQLRAVAVPVSGTFFQNTQPVSGPLTDAQLRASAVPVSGFPATQAISAAALPLPSGASTETTLSALNGKVTACNTGAVTISAALPAGTNAIGTTLGPALTKGTQGATGHSVQDLKDAGRTNVSITAEAVAGAASEALITTTQSKAYATATTGTSYNVTAGKTLRLQALTITFVATATTANSARIRLRVNPSGAAIISSAILFSIRIGLPSATFIIGEAYTVVVPFPDGIEIPGGGGLALTHIEAAANGTIDASLQGFEY